MNTNVVTWETTTLFSIGYSTPRLQTLQREKKPSIHLFSVGPVQKPPTLPTDSISPPLGYLSRRVLIKWHNSGHWCGENYRVYFNKVFWCPLLQLPEVQLAAHDKLGTCCTECDSACRLQTPIKHGWEGGDSHLCSPSKHTQNVNSPRALQPKRLHIPSLFFWGEAMGMPSLVSSLRKLKKCPASYTEINLMNNSHNLWVSKAPRRGVTWTQLSRSTNLDVPCGHYFGIQTTRYSCPCRHPFQVQSPTRNSTDPTPTLPWDSSAARQTSTSWKAGFRALTARPSHKFHPHFKV